MPALTDPEAETFAPTREAHLEESHERMAQHIADFDTPSACGKNREPRMGAAPDRAREVAVNRPANRPNKPETARFRLDHATGEAGRRKDLIVMGRRI